MASENREIGPPVGEVGLVESGPHRGSYVLIERDERGIGYHIWILKRWPGVLPNDGWDAWVDDEIGLQEWLADGDFKIRWTGSAPAN